MTAAADAAASVFDAAYRGAGGSGDTSGRLRTDAPHPARPRPVVWGGSQVVLRRLHPDEGRGEMVLSESAPSMRSGRRALPRTELRLIALSAASLARAERRRAAIAAVTDEPDPAWSMTAHPVAAAMLSLYGIAPVPMHMSALPAPAGEDKPLLDRIAGRDTCEAGYAALYTAAGHVWCGSFKEERTGLAISQAYGRNLVRIHVPEVNVPETVAAAMRGRPISSLLAHPLIDLVPDLPIARTTSLSPRKENGRSLPARLVIEVVARAVPLAGPPRGADTGWMRLPAVHYGDVEH